MLASWLVWAAVVVLLPVAYFALVLRSSWGSRRQLPLASTAVGGAVAAMIAETVVQLVRRWGELEQHSDALTAVLFSVLVVAPMTQALLVTAVLPGYRSSAFRTPYDGVLFPAAVGIGFGVAQAGWFLWGVEPSIAGFLRGVLSVVGHPAFAILWGYALGLEPRKRIGGRLFSSAFTVSVVLYGLFEHIAFRRTEAAAWAAVPLLLFVGAAAGLGGRELYRRSTHRPSGGRRARRLLRSLQPPSLRAMRAALRRTERPLMLTWIAFGSLVTSGVISVSLAAAVFAGHRLGVDFAAVDRAETTAAAIAPLILIGFAALLAFPVSGFLIARASSTRTVLEPALSCAIAIVGTLVLLGFAAPVAVVFALACAPIAFALACAGAWVGLAR